MTYVPGTYQGELLETYLDQELQRISEVLAPMADGAIEKRHKVPAKPRSGLYLADGTDWDPGSGVGLYRYDEDSSTFVAVESGAAPVDSVFGRTGAVTAQQADYDGFFLTPTEGDAAYSALGHGHTLADISDSGALAALATVGTTEIDNDAVTLAKMANIATARILGRVTGGSGDPEALTGTQATTLLNAFSSTLKGLAPLSGGGTTNFLRADGTWAVPAGGAVDSVFGRTGAVTALQADYDSFFLTPAEGNAAYLGISAKATDSQLLDAIDSTGFARLGTTAPALNYLYTARSSTSSAFYVRQGGSGIICRLFKNATPGDTGATSPRFELDNDARPSVTGLAVPHYITSGYASGKITVSASAPSSPSQGDLWFDTS